MATLHYESAGRNPAERAWIRWVAIFLAPLLGGVYGILTQYGGWVLMLIFLVAAPLMCAWLLDRWRAWIAMELNGSAMLGSLAYGYFTGPSPSMAFVNEGTIFLLLVSLAFAQLAWVHD